MEEEKIILNFNHVKKTIKFPDDDKDELLKEFLDKFKDFGADKNKKYSFKFEDKFGQRHLIKEDDDLCPSNFEAKKEIFVEERKDGDESSDNESNESDSEKSKKDSLSKSQEKSNEENEKGKASEEEEEKIEVREIKVEKEQEEEKVLDEKEMEKEMNELINLNKRYTISNRKTEQENLKLENDLNKLELELQSLKGNQKTPKKIDFDEELKKIKKNHETKNKEYEDEIKSLNKINKELQNKLNELQLASNFSMNIKKNKPNKKNRKEEMLNLINKISKKQKKEKEPMLNKNDFEKLINEEETQKKKFIEQSKLKLKKLKENKNNTTTNNDINDKNEEMKENEELKLKKLSNSQKLENLEKEKNKIEEEYKSKITLLKNELEEKRKTKIENKKKEEEKRQREFEEQRKIKIEMENKKREEEKRQRELEEQRILEEKRLKELEENKKKELKLKLEEEKRQKELEKIKNKPMNNIGVKNSFNLLDDNQPNNFLDDNNNKKEEKIKEEPKEEPEFDPLEREDFKIKRKRTTAQTMAKMAFSYDCLNMINLQQIIYLGTDKAEIPVILKNNGKFTWPLNRTKLVFDKNSKIKGKNVELKALASNEEQTCKVVIEGLAKLGEGVYDAHVWFNANGENCGKMIILRVEIKKKEEDPIKLHMKEIKEFRNEYNLSEEDGYTDNYLYELLSENDFSFEDTFLKIIDN